MHRNPTAAARPAAGIVVCLALAYGACTVRAQSVPEAPRPNKDGTPRSGQRAMRLIENLTGRLHIEGTWYPQAPQPRQGLEDTDAATVQGRLHLSTWMGTGATRLDLAGWIEYGTRGGAQWEAGVPWPPDHEDRSRPVGIERLVVSHLFGDAEQFELAVGKDLFRSSVAVIGTLADRHSVAYDLNDPLDPKSVGVWQARAQYMTDGGQLTLAALPFFEPTKRPVPASRWYPGDMADQAEIPPNIDIVVDGDPPSGHFPELGWLLRYMRQGARLDWFMLGYRGYSNYVTYELIDFRPGRATVAEVYAPCWQVAAGVSTSRGAWEFHGESLYHRPDDRRSDAFVAYLLGTTARIARLAEAVDAEDVSLTVEYRGETEGQQAERQLMVLDPEFLRVRSAVLSQLCVRVDADLALTVRWFHELDRESAHYGRIEIRRRLCDNLHLALAGELFEARDRRVTALDRNDRLQVRLSYRF